MSQASYSPTRDFVLLAEELGASQQAEDAFLNSATCMQSFNSRRIFLELISIPSLKTIDRYLANNLVHRWVLSTTAEGFTNYFRVDVDSNTIDSTVSFNAIDVKIDFGTQRSEVLGNVLDFARVGGASALRQIMLGTHRSDSEKIETIIRIKNFAGVPMREPLAIFSNGGLRLGFPRNTLTPLQMENALRYVVGLPSIRNRT